MYDILEAWVQTLGRFKIVKLTRAELAACSRAAPSEFGPRQARMLAEVDEPYSRYHWKI
jgi:hypothetical protein